MIPLPQFFYLYWRNEAQTSLDQEDWKMSKRKPKKPKWRVGFWVRRSRSGKYFTFSLANDLVKAIKAGEIPRVILSIEDAMKVAEGQEEYTRGTIPPAEEAELEFPLGEIPEEEEGA